jgi:NADH:ubiquinone reductase (H+-translocating)
MSSRSTGPMTTHAAGRPASRHKVVIIGSGFGGLFGAQALRKADVDITLVARTTHHLFQPLLYQVATGILSEGEIAPSTREVLRRQDNVEVVLGNVTDIDLAARTVTSRTLDRRNVYHYDSLIVAAGSGQSWFGHDEFAAHAPGMKSIDDALELRGRIFGSFELAELAADAGRSADVERLMTFVVVGAGPTGVEMAGQIAELSGRTLKHDFRRIDPTKARVILLDAADAVLGSFGDRLGRKATNRLEEMGVEVRLGAKVVDVDATGIVVEHKDGTRNRIESVCKVWAAGVQASPLGRQLAEQCGAEVDRSGRVHVNEDLTLPGHPEVFVVGDMIALDHLPGVAQVAIQGARHAAEQIERRVAGEATGQPFHYFDKGSMATISRFSAVASIGRLRLSGFLAWVMWLAVHLVYIIGFKNRITTLLHWALSFLGRGRAERTVTEQQTFARLALEQLGANFAPSLERTMPKDEERGDPQPPLP